MNKFKFHFLLLAVFGLFIPETPLEAYTYTPMEQIPGFGAPSDFSGYITALYNFGLWAIGICAMFMIMIGGYMYLMSAGNNSSMTKAKSIITDALIGLFLALFSYLLLYEINPDLVNITGGENSALMQGSSGTGNQTIQPGIEKSGGETCKPVATGICTIANLKTTCLSSNAEKFSRVCGIESQGGNPAAISKTDKCKDGSYFSVGLFQINMINSATSIGCKDIFSKNGKGPQGNCKERKTNGSGVSYCALWDCEVKDKPQYNRCLKLLQNGQTNVQIACKLSNNGSNLVPWKITRDRCGLN